MARVMAPEDEHDEEFDEEEAPRSIFSATWFRVVLVVLGIGVVGAIAVPYVLDVVNPPEPPLRSASAPTSAPQGANAPKPAAPAPSTPSTAMPSEGANAKVADKPADATPPTSSPQSSTSSAISTPAPAAKSPETKSSEAKSSERKSSETKSAESKPIESKSASAPKASVVAEAPKPSTKPVAKAAPAPEKDSSDTAAEKVAPKKTEKSASRVAAVTKATDGGDWFVQVGAFGDAGTAKRVAARLREQNYPVVESIKRTGNAPAPSAAPRTSARPTGSAGDRYDVIVSGGSAEEINTRLASKGLASEPLGDTVRIRPSLPMRDAVALSKDLNGEGFKVQMRRATGASAEPAAPVMAPSSDGGGQTFYRVRVGGYPDRATALAALKDLQEKGYQPFVAKGRD